MDIIHADALNMPLADCSMDAIVTDPPYGLEFMGKEWDKLEKIPKGYIECQSENSIIKKKMPRFHQTVEHNSSMQLWHSQWLTEAYRVLKPGGSMLVMGGTRTFHRLMCAMEDAGFIIKDTLMWIYGSGFPKAQEASVLVDAKILGISTKEVNRRRKVVAESPYKKLRGIASKRGELYGKGLDGSGEFNITLPLTPEGENWDGFKIGGIKPAYEPIVWAAKPPDGSYVDNVLKWGVGAVNVDECRIGYQNNDDFNKADRNYGTGTTHFGNTKVVPEIVMNRKGRFPANIILSHRPECVQVGMKRVKGSHVKEGDVVKIGTKNLWLGKNKQNTPCAHTDKDGLETVESWQCHPDCPVKVMDEQSGVSKSSGGRIGIKGTSIYEAGWEGKYEKGNPGLGDSGGASRFFYCAKASRSERNKGLEGMEEKDGLGQRIKEKGGTAGMGNHNPICKRCGGSKIKRGDELHRKICKCKNPEWELTNKSMKNNHPTVKPIALFEWLIKLVTREGQTVLDPFLGSGTTAISAHNTGRKCIGIEKEGEYIEIAKRRVTYWETQPKQMEIQA